MALKVTGLRPAARLGAAAAAVMALASCGLVAAPDEQVLTCQDAAFVTMPVGQLFNNQWNKQAATGRAARQCLLSRPTPEGDTQFGWTWHWPDRASLYAYPEILVGRSPWRDEPSNDARFPRRIDLTRRLDVSYDFSLTASGQQNLATDLWISSQTQVPGSAPDPSLIKAELMIWTHASPGLVDESVPPVAEVDVGGQSWVVRVTPGKTDASGASRARWTLISYHAKVDALQARLDVRAFLRDAVSRGLIDAQDIVSGIEVGNEIVSGTGTTWIQAFAVAVE